MSLSSTIDDWLKPASSSDVVVNGDDVDPAMSIAASMPDMPDLGLGTLSAEDIKWVDLEFLDLASGPPANQERNRNKNPTLGCNFPDIFFDMTSGSGSGFGGGSLGATGSAVGGTSSLFNSFSVDDPPTQQLDLEEKNILADLFPPSAQIEQTHADDVEDAFASPISPSHSPPRTHSPPPSSSPPRTCPEATATSASSTSIESDMLGIKQEVGNFISEESQTAPNLGASMSHAGADQFGSSLTKSVDKEVKAKKPKQSGEKKRRGGNNNNRVKKENADSSPIIHPVANGISKLAASKRNSNSSSVAKISVKTDRSKNVTQVTILPSEGQKGQSHSFQINTSNLSKVGKMLKPLQLDRLSVFNKGVPPPPPPSTTPSAKGRNGSVQKPTDSLATSDLTVRDVKLDKDQVSLRVLEDHGIKLSGFTCATTSNGQKFWVCPEKGCKKAYPRPSKLKIHLLGHRDIKPFKCDVENCGWAFTTAFKLKRHMNSHGKVKTAVCTRRGCGKEFSELSNLKKHMLLHERELVYRCKDCGKEYDTQPEYVKHLKAHKESQLLAAAAAAAAAESQASGDGGDDESGGGLAKFTCKHTGCGKTFKTQSLLKTHFRLHTGSRPFVCTFEGCTWAFPTSSKLRRHERGHKNIRSYVCNICQKSYLRSEHLKGHQLSHDGDTQPFVCAFERCGQKFSAKSSLYVHMKQHAREKSGKVATRLLQGRLRCLLDSCDQTFLYKKDLQAHMQLYHSAPQTPQQQQQQQQLATEQSQGPSQQPSSQSLEEHELDFIALLSAVDDGLPLAVHSAANATPTLVAASNGLVLDHVVGSEESVSKEQLVTVDTSAITPVKNPKPERKKVRKGGSRRKGVSLLKK